MSRAGTGFLLLAVWALWPAAAEAGWWRGSRTQPATTNAPAATATIPATNAPPVAPAAATNVTAQIAPAPPEPPSPAPAAPAATSTAAQTVASGEPLAERTRIAELDGEVAARNERIARLENDLERVREELKRTNARADALTGVPQTLIEGLRAILQAETVDRREFAKLARKFPDLDPLLGWLAETVLTREETFRKQAEELDRVREEYAAARREFGTSQADLIKRVQRTGETATESMRRREALLQDLSAARTALRESEKAATVAQSTAEEATKERAKLAESVSLKDAQIESLRNRMAADRQQTDARIAKLTAAEKEARAARDAAVTGQEAAAKEALAIRETAARDEETRTRKIRVELTDLRDQLAEREKRIEALLARVKTAEAQTEQSQKTAGAERDRRLVEAEAQAEKSSSEVETLRKALRERERAMLDQQAEAKRLRAAVELDLRAAQEQLALAMERQSDLRRQLAKMKADETARQPAPEPATPAKSATSPSATDNGGLSEIEAEMQHVRSALEDRPAAPAQPATASDAKTDAERKKRVEETLKKAREEMRNRPLDPVR